MRKQVTTKRTPKRKATSLRKGAVKIRARKRAERIINATGRYSAKVRALVKTTLNDSPSQLPQVFAVIDKIDKRVESFGDGLHAFASEAYTLALDYYVKHHNNPAALAAFTRALRVGKERTR
jgi:hypothetical protein